MPQYTQQLKHYHTLAIFFVLLFVLSKFINYKFAQIHTFTFDVGLIVYPLSYVITGIITEVYGGQRARQLILIAIIANGITALIVQVAIWLPSAHYWTGQEAYAEVFNSQFRLFLASSIAYFIGDNVNRKVISHLKLIHLNHWVKTRLIVSTALGVGIDSSLFLFLAFYGVIPFKALVGVMLFDYIVKVAYEAIVSPISARISFWLKQSEGIDIYTKPDIKISSFSFNIDENAEVNRFNETFGKKNAN